MITCVSLDLVYYLVGGSESIIMETAWVRITDTSYRVREKTENTGPQLATNKTAQLRLCSYKIILRGIIQLTHGRDAKWLHV